MRARIWSHLGWGSFGPCLLLAVVATGCASTLDGGSAEVAQGRPDAATADGDVPAPLGDAAVVTGGYDVFAADVCPGGRPPALRQYRCDPFAERACPRGYTCRPFVDPPTVACGAETYRAECFVDGRVAVGGFCQLGTDCAADTACFTTAAANRCLRLCRLDGTAPACPRGTVCEPTDLPNIGACL